VPYRNCVVMYLGLTVLSATMPAHAGNRITLHSSGPRADTITIDETSSPPMITVTAGVRVRGSSGSLLDLGGGKFQILVPGNVRYHLKARGGVDTVTIIDGPGSSIYWVGVGGRDDTVVIHDGPGNDRYTVECKRGHDTVEIHDDSGDGDDSYYVKGASGDELFSISDGAGNDTYRVRGGRGTDELEFTDTGGDTDVVEKRSIEIECCPP